MSEVEVDVVTPLLPPLGADEVLSIPIVAGGRFQHVKGPKAFLGLPLLVQKVCELILQVIEDHLLLLKWPHILAILSTNLEALGIRLAAALVQG